MQCFFARIHRVKLAFPRILCKKASLRKLYNVGISPGLGQAPIDTRPARARPGRVVCGRAFFVARPTRAYTSFRRFITAKIQQIPDTVCCKYDKLGDFYLSFSGFLFFKFSFKVHSVFWLKSVLKGRQILVSQNFELGAYLNFLSLKNLGAFIFEDVAE